MIPEQSALPHVVVLGAGFGGLTFAQKFPAGLARITVVDRNNHHLFFPLLYQVATAGLSAPDITQPIRSVLRERPDTTVLMDDVVAVDLPARRVVLHGGELRYDYLVLALGSTNAYFGHPEWEQHAPGLKSIDDALRLRRGVLEAFERAECTDDPVERERLLTIVVIGGGPTGVELAGAFAELKRHVLTREFRRARATSGRVPGRGPRSRRGIQHPRGRIRLIVTVGLQVARVDPNPFPIRRYPSPPCPR